MATGAEALFDMNDDPLQRNNLIHEQGGAARRLRRSLEAEIGVESLDEVRAIYAGRTTALRSLGYL